MDIGHVDVIGRFILDEANEAPVFLGDERDAVLHTVGPGRGLAWREHPGLDLGRPVVSARNFAHAPPENLSQFFSVGRPPGADCECPCHGR